MSSEDIPAGGNNLRPRRAHSEATKEKQRRRALEQGQKRRAVIEARISTVQQKIEAERKIDLSKSTEAHKESEVPVSLKYAAISRAELLRMASVNETTLLNNVKYEDFLFALDRWLDKINFKPTIEGAPAEELTNEGGPRTLKERLAAWKDLYECLAQSHRDTELELQDTKAVLQKRLKEISDLVTEVSKLSAALQSASGKVVGFPAR